MGGEGLCLRPVLNMRNKREDECICTHSTATNPIIAGACSTHAVTQQVLVQAVGPEAQEVLERQVACKRRQSLPKRLGALLPNDGRAAVVDACTVVEIMTLAGRYW